MAAKKKTTKRKTVAKKKASKPAPEIEPIEEKKSVGLKVLKVLGGAILALIPVVVGVLLWQRVWPTLLTGLLLLVFLIGLAVAFASASE